MFQFLKSVFSLVWLIGIITYLGVYKAKAEADHLRHFYGLSIVHVPKWKVEVIFRIHKYQKVAFFQFFVSQNPRGLYLR